MVAVSDIFRPPVCLYRQSKEPAVRPGLRLLEKAYIVSEFYGDGFDHGYFNVEVRLSTAQPGGEQVLASGHFSFEPQEGFTHQVLAVICGNRRADANDNGG